MVAGPMPADHTNVGGQPSSFNTDDEAPDMSQPNPDPSAVGTERYEPQQPPVEQHSPTKVHVPGWRVIVLGGSGGMKGRIRAE